MGHVFISYSTQDADYANALADKLRDEGFDVWIDNVRLRASDDWWTSIVKAIWACDAFIVVLSPQSDQSDYVPLELMIAKNRNKRLFPILIEGNLNTPNWQLFVRTQTTFCKDKSMPQADFFRQLREVVTTRQERGRDVTEDQSSTAIETDELMAVDIANSPTPNKLRVSLPLGCRKLFEDSQSIAMIIAALIIVIGAIIAAFVVNSSAGATETPSALVASTNTIIITDMPTVAPTNTVTITKTPIATATHIATPTHTSTISPEVSSIPTLPFCGEGLIAENRCMQIVNVVINGCSSAPYDRQSRCRPMKSTDILNLETVTYALGDHNFQRLSTESYLSIKVRAIAREHPQWEIITQAVHPITADGDIIVLDTPLQLTIQEVWGAASQGSLIIELIDGLTESKLLAKVVIQLQFE